MTIDHVPGVPIHPFRFGVIAESVRTKPELDHLVRQAEDAGVSTLLIRDHFIAPPFGDQLGPLTTLAYVAATSTLNVGTIVIDNDYRHPAILAKEAATLALLSEGRFELGLGAGWLRDEYAAAGLRYDPNPVRIDRLEEAIPIIRGLLAGETVTAHGTHYAVTNHANFPVPAVRPKLMIGAGAPRMLALAGREADILSLMGSSVASGALSFDPATRTMASFAAKIERVRAAAGERFARIELSLILDLEVTGDPETVAAARADRQPHPDWTATAVLADPAIAIGSVDAIVDQLQSRRAALGLSYLIVPDHQLAAAAPVIARLAGA